MVRHCLSGPEAVYHFEGWIQGEAAGERVMAELRREGEKLGYFHPPDRFGLLPAAAIRAVKVAGDRLGVRILDKAQIPKLKQGWVNEQLRAAVPQRFRQGSDA